MNACFLGRSGKGAGETAFSGLDFSPMDDSSPLSPKANAFSIASLISATEQAGNATFDKPSTGLDKHDQEIYHRSFKMHYSTVTREMEGMDSLLSMI